MRRRSWALHGTWLLVLLGGLTSWTINSIDTDDPSKQWTFVGVSVGLVILSAGIAASVFLASNRTGRKAPTNARTTLCERALVVVDQTERSTAGWIVRNSWGVNSNLELEWQLSEFDLAQEPLVADTEIFDPEVVLRSSLGAMALVAGPGYGKSQTLLEMTRVAARGVLAGGSGPVPVLLDAASYNGGSSPEEWVAARASERYRVSEATVHDLFEAGQVQLLVDGLEELDEATLNGLFRGLARLMRERPESTVVVAGRPSTFAALGESVPGMRYVELLRASEGSLLRYVGSSTSHRRLTELLGRNDRLRDTLTEPLLCNAAMLIYFDGSRLLPADGEIDVNRLLDDWLLDAVERVAVASGFAVTDVTNYLRWIGRVLAARSAFYFVPGLVGPSLLSIDPPAGSIGSPSRPPSYFIERAGWVAAGIGALVCAATSLLFADSWLLWAAIGVAGGLIMRGILRTMVRDVDDDLFAKEPDYRVAKRLRFGVSPEVEGRQRRLLLWTAGLGGLDLILVPLVGLWVGLDPGLMIGAIVVLVVLEATMLLALYVYREPIPLEAGAPRRLAKESGWFYVPFGLLGATSGVLDAALAKGLVDATAWIAYSFRIPAWLEWVLSGVRNVFVYAPLGELVTFHPALWIALGALVGGLGGVVLAAAGLHIFLRTSKDVSREVARVNGYDVSLSLSDNFLDQLRRQAVAQRVGASYQFSHDLIRDHFAREDGRLAAIHSIYRPRSPFSN